MLFGETCSQVVKAEVVTVSWITKLGFYNLGLSNEERLVGFFDNIQEVFNTSFGSDYFLHGRNAMMTPNTMSAARPRFIPCAVTARSYSIC